MAASAWSFFFLLIVLVLSVGYLSLRLRQAHQHLSDVHKIFENQRELVLSHLRELEGQLAEMRDLAIVWNPEERDWRVKRELGAEGITVYLAKCRAFAQEQLSAGEDGRSVDMVVGTALQRLAQRNAHSCEQLCKLLTDDERARWLNSTLPRNRESVSQDRLVQKSG